MNQRARVKHEKTFQQRLNDEALHLRDEAAALTSGKDRKLLLKRADQAEKTSRIDAWLSSSGLRPPK
jgi:hypothetical protein